MDVETERPPKVPTRGPQGWMALAGLLGLSLIANAALIFRGPTIVQAPAIPPPACPPEVVCPAPVICEVCPVCEVCPELPEFIAGENTGTGNGGTGGTRPPRVDETAAAEGEAHLTHAETVGEVDPVQLAAQRRVADGVDRITASHSPVAARRFIQRNLPAMASMDCAFRDPAAAEHVRMRLREMNDILPEAERLSEAQLTRYERDLRCPRE
jgi:hypothetical protein